MLKSHVEKNAISIKLARTIILDIGESFMRSLSHKIVLAIRYLFPYFWIEKYPY